VARRHRVAGEGELLVLLLVVLLLVVLLLVVLLPVLGTILCADPLPPSAVPARQIATTQTRLLHEVL